MRFTPPALPTSPRIYGARMIFRAAFTTDGAELFCKSKKSPRANGEKCLPFLARYGKISFARGCSPVGQSASFTSKRSWVRAPPSPPNKNHPMGGFLFGLCSRGARRADQQSVLRTVCPPQGAPPRDCAVLRASSPQAAWRAPPSPPENKESIDDGLFVFALIKVLLTLR